MDKIKRIKTISGYHQVMGHSKPLHPLVSIIHLEDVESFAFVRAGEIAEWLLLRCFKKRIKE